MQYLDHSTSGLYILIDDASGEREALDEERTIEVAKAHDPEMFVRFAPDTQEMQLLIARDVLNSAIYNGEWLEGEAAEEIREASGPVVTRTDGTRYEVKQGERFRFSVEAMARNLDSKEVS